MFGSDAVMTADDDQLLLLLLGVSEFVFVVVITVIVVTTVIIVFEKGKVTPRDPHNSAMIVHPITRKPLLH